MDAELRRAETIREFGKRAMTDPLAVTFRFGSVELRGEAIFTPDRLSVAGVSKQNHPDATSAMTAALEKAVVEGADGMTVQLAFRSPDFRKASVGWLRTGYLVAFATLGYLYILREELEVVRQQIREPEAEILSRYCVMTRSGPTEQLIAFVSAPAELESVLVHCHDCAVLLPSHASAGTYERLASIDPWPPGEQTMAGSIAPWPSRPAYALDRAALDRS